jgi:hypothetical protein
LHALEELLTRVTPTHQRVGVLLEFLGQEPHGPPRPPAAAKD